MGEYEANLLYERGVIAEFIESLRSEYDRPENDSRYNKWNKLLVANIGDSELHKRDTVGDAAEIVCEHIRSSNEREFK